MNLALKIAVLYRSDSTIGLRLIAIVVYSNNVQVNHVMLATRPSVAVGKKFTSDNNLRCQSRHVGNACVLLLSDVFVYILHFRDQ